MHTPQDPLAGFAEPSMAANPIIHEELQHHLHAAGALPPVL